MLLKKTDDKTFPPLVLHQGAETSCKNHTCRFLTKAKGVCPYLPWRFLTNAKEVCPHLFLSPLSTKGVCPHLPLELNKAASMAKQKSRLEDEYMYFSDILEDEKEEAREIGWAEGRAEGEIKRAMEAARNLLAMNILTHEQIAAAQRLSVEEVDRIAEEIKSETISLQ